MEASPSDLTKWMAEIIAARATENWLTRVKLPCPDLTKWMAEIIANLPKPTHVHKWEREAVDRNGFSCEAPGCEIHWLNPEEVETLLNEHFSTLGVKYENVPNLSGQAVYSQVTTPWTERQA